MGEKLRVLGNACLQAQCSECCRDVQLRLTDEEYAYMVAEDCRLCSLMRELGGKKINGFMV